MLAWGLIRREFSALGRGQAKDTAWRYLRRYAEPLLAKPPNESELRVDLVARRITINIVKLPELVKRPQY
jgi:hypothetical protein